MKPGFGTNDRQRGTYSRGTAGLLSGETVTPGRFRCTACGYEHEVEEGKVSNLPICPHCQGEHWELH